MENRVRKAGILVIALHTPLDPSAAADATFATNNMKAGELIGQWSAKTLGDKAKGRARAAYVAALIDQLSVDWKRDFGFSKDFGIENSDACVANKPAAFPRPRFDGRSICKLTS